MLYRDEMYRWLSNKKWQATKLPSNFVVWVCVLGFLVGCGARVAKQTSYARKKNHFKAKRWQIMRSHHQDRNEMINAHESDCGLISEEQSVEKYLDSFLEVYNDRNDTLFRRTVCCESSRSLYCHDCCRLLVPDHSVPVPVLLSRRRKRECVSTDLVDHSGQRALALPFNLHIILDDRRGSATGLHAVALINGRDGPLCTSTCNDEDTSEECSARSTSIASFELGSVKLVDLATDMLPTYRNCTESTYLLFPSPGESVPLALVASKVQTLVVLDCKWTKSKICRSDEQLSSLQKVHLTSPPEKSFYWRWHNAGPGMLSTIEAIYYAAIEVMRIKHSNLNDAGHIMTQSDSRTDQNNLIHLLWLFGHLRAATMKSAQIAGIPAPCTDEGKEIQRAMRKQKGTWRQLRHKEDERRLNERMKLQMRTK